MGRIGTSWAHPGDTHRLSRETGRRRLGDVSLGWPNCPPWIAGHIGRIGQLSKHGSIWSPLGYLRVGPGIGRRWLVPIATTRHDGSTDKDHRKKKPHHGGCLSDKKSLPDMIR